MSRRMAALAARRNHRRRSCQHKRRYPCRWKAERAALAARRRTGHWIAAYPCLYCGGWHIGHVGRE